MELVHSCCPEKKDIHAMKFVLKETIKLAPYKTIKEYECVGCKTIVMMLEYDQHSQ